MGITDFLGDIEKIVTGGASSVIETIGKNTFLVRRCPVNTQHNKKVLISRYGAYG